MADEHKTKTNPTGAIGQCNKREVHAPHEYQAEFGSYFNAYCLGIPVPYAWVEAAKAFVELYEAIDGISDEMSSRDFHLTQEYYEKYKAAKELLYGAD